MMALRARGGDENGIEWRGDQQAEIGLTLVGPMTSRDGALPPPF
jgi:hypothetical protein